MPDTTIIPGPPHNRAAGSGIKLRRGLHEALPPATLAGGAMRDTELDTAIAEHWRTMRRIQALAPLAVVLAVRARMDMLIDRRWRG